MWLVRLMLSSRNLTTSYISPPLGLMSGIIAFLDKEGFSSADAELLGMLLGISSAEIRDVNANNVGWFIS